MKNRTDTFFAHLGRMMHVCKTSNIEFKAGY